MYLSYWFASLYVVIEAWRTLKLSDPKVNALINSPYTDLLRRYRNGIFHYQRKYFDDRVMEFVNQGGAAYDWTFEVHDAFSKWFLQWYEERGIPHSVRNLGELGEVFPSTPPKVEP